MDDTSFGRQDGGSRRPAGASPASAPAKRIPVSYPCPTAPRGAPRPARPLGSLVGRGAGPQIRVRGNPTLVEWVDGLATLYGWGIMGSALPADGFPDLVIAADVSVDEAAALAASPGEGRSCPCLLVLRQELSPEEAERAAGLGVWTLWFGDDASLQVWLDRISRCLQDDRRGTHLLRPARLVLGGREIAAWTRAIDRESVELLVSHPGAPRGDGNLVLLPGGGRAIGGPVQVVRAERRAAGDWNAWSVVVRLRDSMCPLAAALGQAMDVHDRVRVRLHEDDSGLIESLDAVADSGRNAASSAPGDSGSLGPEAQVLSRMPPAFREMLQSYSVLDHSTHDECRDDTLQLVAWSLLAARASARLDAEGSDEAVTHALKVLGRGIDASRDAQDRRRSARDDDPADRGLLGRASDLFATSAERLLSTVRCYDPGRAGPSARALQALRPAGRGEAEAASAAHGFQVDRVEPVHRPPPPPWSLAPVRRPAARADAEQRGSGWFSLVATLVAIAAAAAFFAPGLGSADADAKPAASETVAGR